MSPIIPPARFFVYILSRLDGRPFYVGKGTGDRPQQHLYEARRGYCKCPKCLIIRDILRRGKDVPVTFAHHTDNEREAYRMERETIHSLGVQFKLCNANAPRPIPPKVPSIMTYTEYTAWLDHIDTPRKERAKILTEWAYRRVFDLEKERKGARLNGKRERVDEIDAEIEMINAEMGYAYQHRIV